MTFQESLQAFLLQLQADGRSQHTVKQYQRHLALFESWLVETARPLAIDKLNHEDVAAFLASNAATHDAAGKKKRPTSINTIRSSLKTFFGFAHAAGYAPLNAGRLIRRALCAPPPPRGLSETDAERLLAALDTAHTAAEKRDRMLIRLILRTGLRIGSALGLDVEDVDVETGELRLRDAKGSRDETVFMPREIADELAGFLDERMTGPVFRGRAQRRLSPRSAQRRLALWRARAGIRCTITPHTLRHTFATKLLNRTGDIALVQAALRHRSIGSTTAYVMTSEKRLKNALSA